MFRPGPNNDLPIGCLVMAAGNSVRFGENKLMIPVDGKAMIRRALETVPAEKFAAVTVVTQYSEVEDLAHAFGFHCIRNDHPELGISRTIRLGTEYLGQTCEAIMYQVSDQPLLRRKSVCSMIDLFMMHPDRIVCMAHDGTRGNPCIFPKVFFPELCALSGDKGGGEVILAHLDRLLLFETDGQELIDADTPTALKKLLST